eukprot:29259-Eustigmatos_ZCMA.PRE.1
MNLTLRIATELHLKRLVVGYVCKEGCATHGRSMRYKPLRLNPFRYLHMVVNGEPCGHDAGGFDRVYE